MTLEAGLLARLGVPTSAAPTRARLCALQRAWCFAQPFHNLDLLAGTRRKAPPLERQEAVARCATGLGGPCHVQSAAFLALLEHAGFDARLCGATITRPDDHLLVHVTLGDEQLLCDVGNGQPYLEPFPLHRSHEQQHLGWVVRSTPTPDGFTLTRRSHDHPAWRVVYQASTAARTWEDFADSIARHHHEPGFGPFLSGLRVVRIGATAMVVVRDSHVIVHRADGCEQTSLDDVELVRFIAGDLGLAALPVAEAVAAWRELTGRHA